MDPLFAVWMFEAVGTVLSTVTEPERLPVLPDTSVAVTLYVFDPALSTAFAVIEALR